MCASVVVVVEGGEEGGRGREGGGGREGGRRSEKRKGREEVERGGRR